MAIRPDPKDLHKRLALLEQAFHQLYMQLYPGYGLHKLKADEHAYQDIAFLRDEIRDLRAELDIRSRNAEAQSAAVVELLSSTTTDLASADTPVRILIPVSVFIDTQDPDTVDNVQAAVHQILEESSFESVYETPEVWGSWFKRLFARSKEVLTSQQAKDNLSRVERALEMQALHVPQSYIDAAQSDGVAKLISSLYNTPNALIQIGSVLLIKVDGTPVVRNLTQVELSYLERNRHLYKSPKDALEELSRIGSDPNRFALPSLEDQANQTPRTV
jgi:hypothetical protein